MYGDQLDPSQHNKEIRQLAIDEIQRCKNKYKDAYMSSYTGELNFLSSIEEQLIKGNTGEATTHGIKKPMSPDNITRSKEFIEFTQKIENEWHPDQKGQFEKLWPEIARAL